MIKYVELTAPEASAYRQAKILSIECNEGDQVKAGDTLFVVQSGKKKLELPSTKTGRIVEFIVTEQENITLSTPLLLLETEVSEPTASAPIESGESVDSTQRQKSKQVNRDARKMRETQKNVKRHEQPSLDLQAGLNDINKEQEPTPSRLVQRSTETENTPMSETELFTVTVPDIGADSAKVIEILVNVGDQIAKEDAIVTLESDKASMDVPSSHAGIIKSISVNVDQDVSEGDALIELTVESNNDAKQSKPKEQSTSEAAASSKTQTINSDSKADGSINNQPTADKPDNSQSQNSEDRNLIEVTIPDIGGDSAKVVDILVSIGDHIDIEESLVTLESDKASMDVPSSEAGIIKSIDVKVDDEVSEGTVVVTLETTSSGSYSDDESQNTASNQEPSLPEENKPKASKSEAQDNESNLSTSDKVSASEANSHASPSIRRFARELGVDLASVKGSGRKNRITKDDVKAHVKSALSREGNNSADRDRASAKDSGSGIPAVPAQDFSKFGDIEIAPLNKVKRLTAKNLHRSWLNVPHVTHHDESNINDLESFRKKMNAEYKAQNTGAKLSPLAFIVKAVVNALQTYPQFNSSLEPGGENLILKKYVHIGIAVDTPNGLVVPVIRNADTKSVTDIAREMGELAAKARDKTLTMSDMSGACFTISSLGGIGGTSFTPIVNAPEVAILGVSRSKMQPVWNGSEFTPGMMLPLSLSYDHRVIDGAEAARFTRHIAEILEDIRRLTV